MDLERGCMQKSVFEMLFLPVLPFLNSFRILLSCLGTAHRICMQLNRDIPCLSHSV